MVGYQWTLAGSFIISFLCLAVGIWLGRSSKSGGRWRPMSLWIQLAGLVLIAGIAVAILVNFVDVLGDL